MGAAPGHLGIQVLGVSPVDHQAGLTQLVLIDLKRLGHAGHPDDHIRFRKSLVEGQNPSSTQFLLKVEKRLLLSGNKEEFTDTGAGRKPATDGTADITGGSDHSHFGRREVDPDTWSIVFNLPGNHPCGVGVAGGEALPIKSCAAHRAVLQQVEILENDRREAAQSRDVDALFLGELHGVEHLAPSRFETAEHFRDETGIDVRTLNRCSSRTGDLNVFHQLRRRTAPDVQIAFSDVIEPEFGRLASSRLKTRGMSDQTKHVVTKTFRRGVPDRSHAPMTPVSKTTCL